MTVPITPLVPAANPQFRPSTSTSSKDCVPAVTAHLLERATAGKIRLTHVDIRRASGAPATRGLYLYEAAAAALELTGITLDVSLYVSRNTVRDSVVGGEAVGVTIHTAETRWAAGGARKTNDYVGPHEIDLLAYTWWPKGEICGCELRTAAAHAEFTVYDPGLTTVPPRQWSAGLVYRAAERLTGAYNRINLLIAPDTEQRAWRANARVQIRSKPTYTGSVIEAHTVDGRRYPGGRTQKGGRWKRANGTYADAWVLIRYTADDWGWVPGRAVNRA